MHPTSGLTETESLHSTTQFHFSLIPIIPIHQLNLKMVLLTVIKSVKVPYSPVSIKWITLLFSKFFCYFTIFMPLHLHELPLTNPSAITPRPAQIIAWFSQIRHLNVDHPFWALSHIYYILFFPFEFLQNKFIASIGFPVAPYCTGASRS